MNYSVNRISIKTIFKKIAKNFLKTILRGIIVNQTISYYKLFLNKIGFSRLFLKTTFKVRSGVIGSLVWSVRLSYTLSVFAPSKFQVIHFTRASMRIDTQHPLQTTWGEIPAKLTYKHVGLIMDTAL